jgi:hypothetical protein
MLILATAAGSVVMLNIENIYLIYPQLEFWQPPPERGFSALSNKDVFALATTSSSSTYIRIGV